MLPFYRIFVYFHTVRSVIHYVFYCIAKKNDFLKACTLRTKCGHVKLVNVSAV